MANSNNRTVIEQKALSSFSDVKLLVAESKAEIAFKTLSELAKKTSNDMQNQVILLQSRFNSWKLDDISGLSPARSEMNSILKHLLELVDKIEKEVDETSAGDLEKLIDTLFTIKENLAIIRTKLEQKANQETSFIGRIWIALMPQLEGTLITICKILYEISQIVKLNEFALKINNEYHQDIMNLSVQNFARFVTKQDINTIDKLHKRLSETFLIQKPLKSEMSKYVVVGKNTEGVITQINFDKKAKSDVEKES